MCKIYNPVGCLTAVKSHLLRYNITEFKSLNEVISFQSKYASIRAHVIARSESAVVGEKNRIFAENEALKGSIESTRESVKDGLVNQIETLRAKLESLAFPNNRGFFKSTIKYYKSRVLKKSIRRHEQELPFRIARSVQDLEQLYQRNEKRYSYLTSDFERAVKESCYEELGILERKKAVIDEVNSLIYGAIGEQKVVKVLEGLSDDYVLINDFCLSFKPPIYNRAENDYIQSIQVDHLLIGPSGIFLIETKNWSERSLNDLSLRSPVSQLRRTNFALFRLLNQSSANLGLNDHHWGKKRIPLKNLLVLINHRPKEEFQFVKVLTLNQLLSYIEYFPPVFNRREAERIADELTELSGSLRVS